MALTPKPFHELLNMNFIIPSYQRGYRWDKEQVETLLDDLEDFINKNKKKNSQFNVNSDIYYCLQPIAVVPDGQNNPNTYTVVDGQQRLTTIYLLLHYLKKSGCPPCPIYSLSMPSRKSQEDYIQDCKFQDIDDKDYTKNIDNFYIRQAYEAIIGWFSKDSNRAFNMLEFLRLFAYKPATDEMHRDVRVIWYEINGATASEAFRRLNYGKIPLTSTELVKALLLQGDRDLSAKEHRRGAAYRRAMEWDEIEHTLQNPYLWAMLAGQSEDSLSHLELILDFVADNLNKEIGNPYTRKSKDVLENKDVREYFNYDVVNELLRRKGEAGIDFVWNEIRKVFNLVINWYDNREWYHLIGLLRILPNKNKRKPRREFVKFIYNLSTNAQNRPVSRLEFVDALKKEICKEVKLPEGIELNNLSYNENNEHIIKILKLLNVKDSIDDKTEENRFAFHLFDAFNVTSLEHIHPQSITTDAKHEDFKNWVAQRSKDFDNLTDEDFKKAVSDIKETRENANIDIEDLAEKRREETKRAITTLKKLSEKREDYEKEENQNDLQKAAKILDKFFGDLSGIDEAELHAISNMALVDQPTNSALQNFLLDRKRKVLMDRHQECDISDLNKKRGTYAPPATRHVFCKEYSKESPGDMRLWRKEDRDKYFEAIKDAYNYFVNA